MKLICQKSNLVAGLNIVSKAVPSRSTMSILQTILVDTTGDRIKLVSNDTEIGIETTIEGTIEEKGYVAIDAKLFVDIVRKLPDNNVTLESDENFMVRIRCESANFNLPGRSGNDFTLLPEIERIDGITISQMTMRSLIQQTIFSIASNDVNKIMMGELIDIENDTIRFVSLDGHRISVRKELLSSSFNAKKVIIPGKTLSEIARILSDDTEKKVEIYFTDKHVLFAFDDTIVVSRLIDGEYFNVDQMLSSDYETKVTINRKWFMDCIDRATLLVKEGDKKPVILNITDLGMELKINSTIGSMNETVDIEKQGKDIMIGFNPKFLIDALRVIDDELIDIYFVNPKAPCFIRNADSTYIYMILPINFKTVD